jgi:hypothetical protein
VLAGAGSPGDSRRRAAGIAGPDGCDIGASGQLGAGRLGGLPQYGVQPLAVNAADRCDRLWIGLGRREP